MAEVHTLAVLIPIFNDWQPLQPLLDKLDAVLASMDQRAIVLVVDDASSDAVDLAAFKRPFVSFSQIHLLSLRRNLGHQRAIAVGLSFIYEQLPVDLVLIMDGDGQDAPEDYRTLRKKCEETGCGAIIFAERKRRSEGVAFRFFYWLFRRVHRVLTGRSAKVGNFSLVPRDQQRRLMVVSELWNNYAAAAYKAKLAIEVVPIDRAVRVAGQTKMNFAALVAHGLSAMSIYNDVIGVRTLSTAVVLTLVAVVSELGVAIARYTLHDPRFGPWLLAGMLTIATLTLVDAVLAVFLLTILASRSAAAFVPLRDYKLFYDVAQRVDV